MRLLRLAAVLSLSSFAFGGSITGVFQGAIVQLAGTPQVNSSNKSAPRWMYVQGRNGTIRRANIAKAVIEYDEDYPRDRRRKQPSESLAKLAIVRITAEQDEANGGEWQATKVSIVSPPGLMKPVHKSSGAVPTLARR